MTQITLIINLLKIIESESEGHDDRITELIKSTKNTKDTKDTKITKPKNICGTPFKKIL